MIRTKVISLVNVAKGALPWEIGSIGKRLAPKNKLLVHMGTPKLFAAYIKVKTKMQVFVKP